MKNTRACIFGLAAFVVAATAGYTRFGSPSLSPNAVQAQFAQGARETGKDQSAFDQFVNNREFLGLLFGLGFGTLVWNKTKDGAKKNNPARPSTAVAANRPSTPSNS